MEKNKSIIMLFIVIILISCKKEDVSNTVQSMIGKEIKIPLGMLCTMNGDSINRFDLLNRKTKVISYINEGDCMGCELSILLHWKRIIPEFNKYNTSVVFIISTSNINKTNSALRQLSIDYPIFYDVEKSFFKMNDIIIDKRLNTFLISENNEILIIGNPVHNKKIESLYFDEIKKLCSF